MRIGDGLAIWLVSLAFYISVRQNRRRRALGGLSMRGLDQIRNLALFFSEHPLTRDRPLGAWARFAAWQIRSRVKDEILIDWIGGQRLAVRRGMTGATGNIYVGLHEFADMLFVLHFLREDDLFLDIGANVGTYTVLGSG